MQQYTDEQIWFHCPFWLRDLWEKTHWYTFVSKNVIDNDFAYDSESLQCYNAVLKLFLRDFAESWLRW